MVTMDFGHIIVKLEQKSKKALELSLKEYKGILGLREDILKIEEILSQPGQSGILLGYYLTRASEIERVSERIERRINSGVKRVEKILSKIGDLLPDEEENIKSFLRKMELSRNLLIKILARGGELHHLLKENPQNWKKIEAKVQESLGNETSPGIRSLVVIFHNLEELEKRLDEKSLEEYHQEVLDKVNQRHREGGSQTIKDMEGSFTLGRLNKIKEQREEAMLKPLRETIREVCLLLSNKYGLKLENKVLPNITYDPTISEEGYCRSEGWIITFKSLFPSGEIIGEEVMHFFRYKALYYKGERSRSEDEDTQEFFGYLGRRMLYQVLLWSKRRKLFRYGPPKVDHLSKLKEKLQEFERAHRLKIMIEEKLKMAKGYAEMSEADRNRLRESLQREAINAYYKIEKNKGHFRGYYHAMRVDLAQINNWQKLLSLSPIEVRKRFFGQKQDYSGL